MTISPAAHTAFKIMCFGKCHPRVVIVGKKLILYLGKEEGIDKNYADERQFGVVRKTPYKVSIFSIAHSGEKRMEVRGLKAWESRMVGDARVDGGSSISAS